MIGTTLTHYRITAKLGEGGMGEVYRAIDTRLGRDVAIKVLPASISRDPQSLARFEREAKALAALNHPNIAGIHGFEADQGTHFLVLELVEGETLAERLQRGALPLNEALTISRQVAEAIQEAHEKGIIHRDLKPGNVKITPSGRVKVLDFGLAKIEETLRGQATAGNDTEAATIRADSTRTGVVMGTPAYMSPEQARGLEVDKRTDIWAFGCCLFECLSGQKPFRGQTATDLMAEVLKGEPAWSQLPAQTPQVVLTLLRRCLEKEPRRRLNSIGDIALTLDETTRLLSAAQSSGGRSRKWLVSAMAKPNGLTFAAVAGMVVLGTVILLWKPWKTADRSTVDRTRPAAAPRSSDMAGLRSLIQPDRWQKVDFDLRAGELDRLLKSNPDDAEAWALHSIIHSLQVMRSYDAGTKPLQVGKASAQHALRLAPGMPLAELAMGMHLTANVSRGGDPAIAWPYLDRGIAGLPDDPIARYAEVGSNWIGYRFEETQQAALAWLSRDPQASYPKWILAQWNLVKRRSAEVEKWAQQVANDNNVNQDRAFVSLFDERYYLQADLSGARTALERAGAGDRASHRMVFSRWLIAMAEHKWDVAFEELQRLPEAMLFDRHFHGPKALLAGTAQQAAGRVEIAKAQFLEADRLLVDELAHDQPNEELRAVHAVTARLGRATEATNELAWVEPMLSRRKPTLYTSQLYILVAEAYGVLGDTEHMLPWLRRLLTGPSHLPFTPASLRFDPRFASVVQQPDVEGLLNEFASLDTPRAAVEPLSSATASVPAEPPAKSIAVLAFENLSPEKTNEIFADGISADLRDALGKVPGLTVKARASSQFFKGKGMPIPEIGRQLSVAYLIEGTVERDGSRVRIGAELVKAADGFSVWSDHFYRELKDIFAVRDEIAALIAQKLALKLGHSSRAIKTVNPEAYRLALEGWRYWYERNEEGFTNAEVAFKKAIDLDPSFALAHAGLANNYVIRSNYRLYDGVGGAEENLAEGRVEAERAIALDPEVAEAHAALGFSYYQEGNWEESDKHFQTALGLNPSYSMALHWHSLVLASRGQLDLALKEMRKAEELDPLAFITIDRAAEMRMFAHRYDEALEFNQRAARLRPDRFLRNLANRVEMLMLLGRTNQAVETARLIVENRNPRTRWTSDAYAAWALKEAGLEKEAARYADERKTSLGGDSYVRGFVLTALGQFAEALPFLEYTPAGRIHILYWDGLFDPYRDDPRFQQLLVNLKCEKDYKVARETLARMLKEQEARK
jgi:serine/threonine protein kinase/TolB-like protein